MKMKQSILYSVMIIFLASCSCKYFDRPWSVPSNAEFNEKENYYYLLDEINGEQRYRRWEKKGNIRYESIKKGNKDYVKHFQHGEVYSEGFEDELLKEKERERNEIPDKHPDVPKNATYSNSLGTWEIGIIKNSKKDGIWIMYSRFSGKIIGYITYKDGRKDGYKKQYSSQTGLLNNEVYFEDDIIVSNIRYYTEEKYKAFPPELKKIENFKIIPPDEPRLEEVIKTLPKF
jgi:antitoxin component YwqK of YwqJK toxin-antitoxin module